MDICGRRGRDDVDATSSTTHATTQSRARARVASPRIATHRIATPRVCDADDDADDVRREDDAFDDDDAEECI